MSVTSVSISCGAAPVGRRDGNRRDVDFRKAVNAEREKRKAADNRQRENYHRRKDGSSHAYFGKFLHNSNLGKKQETEVRSQNKGKICKCYLTCT